MEVTAFVCSNIESFKFKGTLKNSGKVKGNWEAIGRFFGNTGQVADKIVLQRKMGKEIAGKSFPGLRTNLKYRPGESSLPRSQNLMELVHKAIFTSKTLL